METVDFFLEPKTKKRNIKKPTKVAGGTAISLASKIFSVIVERESLTIPSVVNQHAATPKAYCATCLA